MDVDATPANRSAGGLVRKVAATLAAYVRGQLIIAFLLSVVYAIGFYALRVPFWYLLAPVCGLLNLVPHFGPLIAMTGGIVVGLIAGFGALRIAEVVGVYVVAFTLEGYVLTPRILGRRLRLRPLYVFLGVLAGGAIFGFPGLILAVPVLAVAAVVYRYFFEPRGGF